MALETSDSVDAATASAQDPGSRRAWLVSLTSFVFVLLQSACTAVIAISGVRVAIGLSALAEATFGIHAPAHGFHRDVIRIPMMIAATVGSMVNLYVVWRIRRLRARPASQWRVQAATPRQRRSEVFQIVLAIVTLVLVAAEWIAHPMIHRVP
jgi:cobalamin synthase